MVTAAHGYSQLQRGHQYDAGLLVRNRISDGRVKGLMEGEAEAHRLLIEAAFSDRTCHEWFQKFNNGGLDVENKDRSGRPKIYDDAELEELLDKDSSQKQKKFALILEVTQQAVSHHLKSLRMINKQDNWVPYEL
ncbi:Mariner Mos1 transposase [Eumeta japonica]|uniref:Mariner Mos1 transposase n=1 Tax=Eumeta variegata TaxID=151549 RepID=A0A4C1ZHH6_EUMVA|nr:Mariner Mos1 transposase [Eumeta japonica]